MNFLANPIDEWLPGAGVGWGGVGKLGVTTDGDRFLSGVMEMFQM